MPSIRSSAVLALATAVAVLTAACSATTDATSGGAGTTSASNAGSTPANVVSGTPRASVGPDDPQAVTPVLADVPVAPIPFAGSDGDTHLVYELMVTNATRSTATFDQLEVIDADTGTAVTTLDKAQLTEALALINSSATEAALEPAQSGIVYLHLAIPDGDAVPANLVHRLQVTAPDRSGEPQQFDEEVARVAVDTRPVPELGPPLRGTGFVAADGCCEAHRHRRAALPINGSMRIAQRYAIDWEQVDDEGRIYVGERTDPASYAIYGDEALAVADGTVVRVVDGLPEQVPGTMPDNIDIEEADGNSVVIDLGGGVWVMYAHLQPGSIEVEVGDTVTVGDVLGLVGNSGNSLAPHLHLHLHLMDTPLPLDASGVPYTIDRFTISGQSVSTEAFDTAEPTEPRSSTPRSTRRASTPTSTRWTSRSSPSPKRRPHPGRRTQGHRWNSVDGPPPRIPLDERGHVWVVRAGAARASVVRLCTAGVDRRAAWDGGGCCAGRP